MRGGMGRGWRYQFNMQRCRCWTKGLEIGRAVVVCRGIGHINERLGQLSHRNRGDDLIAGCIDDLNGIAVFQADVNPASITRIQMPCGRSPVLIVATNWGDAPASRV